MTRWTCQGMGCNATATWPNKRCSKCQREFEQAVTANEPSLFDVPKAGDARTSDPLPSREAAAANLVARQHQKRQIAKRLLLGPATARDLRDITENQQNRVSKRLGEMQADGLVEVFEYVHSPRRLGRYRLTEAGIRDAELIVRGAA